METSGVALSRPISELPGVGWALETTNHLPHRGSHGGHLARKGFASSGLRGAAGEGGADQSHPGKARRHLGQYKAAGKMLKSLSVLKASESHGKLCPRKTRLDIITVITIPIITTLY
ncbi:hypothetical protein E2C01_066357 [Portunus trituberculatus]|uniref:Uncharacterized protein n=1 Tax=Portunus trituberculatus TaxID=210409 RepID=A0A5B7HUF8_PORTR|nr:hypothetical protein [Portunus trituberculatus]